MISTNRSRWGLAILCVLGAGAVAVIAGNAGSTRTIDAAEPLLPAGAARGAHAVMPPSANPDFPGTTASRGGPLELSAALDVNVEVSGVEHDHGSNTSSASYSNDGSVLGTNLTGPSDWSPEWAFVDAFKMSRDWISGSKDAWDDHRPLDLDEHGWVKSLRPGQIARTIMLMAARNPAGQYTVLYDGKGTIQYEDDAKRDAALSSPGRDVITVNPRVQLRLEITATDPADYIRNIRVIMPGGGAPEEPYSWWIDAKDCPRGSFKTFEQAYAEQVFHPAFLASIKSYRALRFMDWMGTNGSAQQKFEGRPTLSDARWRGRGIPLEIMCALANRLHADPWFNVPHLADDDYVSQMAALIRRCLAPGLTPHIEYSNEVWNTTFPQYKYAEAQGLQLGFTKNAFGAALQFYSQRSAQVFTIFERVYGAQAQLVRVMAAQAANPWTSEQVLEFNKAFEHTDALAIAPYFGRAVGPDVQDAVQAMSVDQLFDYMRNDPGGLAMSISWMKQQAAVAKKFGVRLVAYEGGQHLVGYQGVENNNTINALFDAFNRDPRIEALYTEYLNAWKQAGGGLFMHFVNTGSYTKWGRWGAEEYLGQPRDQAPKFAALQRYIEAIR